MRRIITATITAAILVTACGSDDSSSEDDVSSSATEAPVATEPAATEPPATEAPTTDSSETEPAATEPTADGDAVAVSMIEWEIIAPTEYAAGSVTFEATNDGEFPHEFVLIRGESYDTLPQAPNGAVDEDALAAGDLIGRTDRFEPTQTASATWELEAGTYVLLCNIAVGPNSHAAAGQTLTVTVS